MGNGYKSCFSLAGLAIGTVRDFVELGGTFQKSETGVGWSRYRVGVITDAPQRATRAGLI